MISLRLIFVSVVWGVNFSIVKYALADFHPLSFTIVRFSSGALFLILIMLTGREPLSVKKEDRAPIVGLGLIGITLYNIFFMYGLKYTTASHSALFISLSPLFAVLIQAVSGVERISRAVGAGIALATLGVYLIIRSHSGGEAYASSGLLGDLLTIIASVLWALYTLKARPLLEKYSPVKVTAYSMAAGSVMLLPIGAYELVSQQWDGISIRAWSALAFSAFISGGIAFTLWYEGVKRIGATRTIVYHYLVPFVAVVFAALFIKERITLMTALGGASVLAGVYLVQTKKTRDGA